MIQVRKELKGWIIKLKIIRQLLCGIFLSNQYKEIEENNTMGKTRNLFKKIRDTKGTFHAKMGSIKDRNGQGGKQWSFMVICLSILFIIRPLGVSRRRRI